MNYDSTSDTLKHIKRVNELMVLGATKILYRGTVHDSSKLLPPEKEGFDEFTPKLKNSVYGSEEYKQLLVGLDKALQHHYANNTHHPEYHPQGIDGMDLFDVLEMFFDWKAATERHETGDIRKSIDINEKRFSMSPQLARIFRNTVNNLKW